MSSPTSAPETRANAVSSQQLLRLLADNIPALVAYFSRENFRCLFANKAYASNFGLDEQSIIGKTVPEIIGTEAFNAIKPYVARAMLGTTIRYERQNRLPDGSERTFEVNLIPHIDDAGFTTAAYVLIHDITRHREAEKAIRDSEERFRKFADATNEGIVFIEGGIIVDCNEAAARMLRRQLA